MPWDTLAQVQLVAERNIYLPRFADAVLKLDAKEVKLQGFMLPLNVGEKQTHFVLTASPSECGFCVSSGPDISTSRWNTIWAAPTRWASAGFSRASTIRA